MLRPPLVFSTAALAFSLCASAASAQTAPGADPGVTVQDCQAAPQAPGATGNAAPAAPSDLTATLDNCNGVLQPPATGDGGIRAPAPDSGTTPVIPPGAVPPQAPNGNG